MNKIPDNFGGLPKKYSSYNTARFVIVPVPFDKTSTWVKGANKGPRAIIEASKNMELYDISSLSEPYRQGIFTHKKIQAKNSLKMITKVYDITKNILNDKKIPIILGGEHSVSLGAITACADYYKDLSLIHLDAHSDCRNEYENSKFNHACVIARAQEKISGIVSIGIRSMDKSEIANAQKNKIFYAHNIIQDKMWQNKVIKSIKNKQVYLSIDLDVLDPSIMPSTGTPEPGGLGWYEVINLIEKIAGCKQVIGFDVVELCPNKTNKAPDFMAAKLIYTILSYVK